MGRHQFGGGRHGASLPVRRPKWLTPLASVLIVALVGALGWLGALVARRVSASPPIGIAQIAPVTPNCPDPAQVQVAVIPALIAAVEAAAKRAVAAGACASYLAQPRDSAEVAAAVLGGSPPGAWIPDSTLWAETVAGGPGGAATVRAVLATSPLVIAVPNRLAAAATQTPTWTDLIAGKLPLRVADPKVSSTTRVALASAVAALGTGQAARTTLGAAMIALSRTQSASDSELFEQASSETALAFPASEARVAAYNLEHPGVGLKAVAPADGTGRFEVPILSFPSKPEVDTAVAALARALTGEEGKATLRAAGYRINPTDEPTLPSQAAGVPVYLPSPPPEALAALVKTWSAVRAEMRMLAVVDVSGSMTRPAGDKTRMELAHQAALTAIAAFPKESVVGLWAFSRRLGGPNQDWSEIVPIRKLTEQVGGTAQIDLMRVGMGRLAAAPRGDTGLYDTIHDAYLQVRDSYDPNRVNSVVLLTDGKNEDPGGRSLTQLVSELQQLRDPARPVVVVLVGIGPDADVTSLKAVSDAVGGRTYAAAQAEQIVPVFVDALLGRG